MRRTWLTPISLPIPRIPLIRLFLLVLAVSLTGCASMNESASAPAAQSAPRPGTPYLPRIETDEAYVSHVENVARRRGVTVRWVNKPVKRKVDQE